MVQRSRVVGALVVGALVLGACADDDGGGASLATETPPPASTGADLAVTGTDSLRFEPDTLTVPAGREISLTFSAETGLEHDFVVEDAAGAGVAGADDAAPGEESDGDLHLIDADPGQATVTTFQIDEPDTYTVYCSVPGHRQGGMLATLTVEAS